jgi:hypothetical protein
VGGTTIGPAAGLAGSHPLVADGNVEKAVTARRRSRPWRLLRHRLNRLLQVSNRRRLLLVEATAGLLAARLALATTPFPRIARRLGGFVSPHEARLRAGLHPIGPEQQALAVEIGWAVTRAARHIPFAAVCLPQAMAARAMLDRRGVPSVMHFGTAKGEAFTLSAHAWLDAAGVEVTGYPLDGSFTEIACLA